MKEETMAASDNPPLPKMRRSTKPGEPEAETPPPPLRLSLLYSLKRHRALAVVTFLVFLALGLVLAYVRGAPTYRATAVIFVSPRFVANLEADKEFDFQSNAQYREYVQQNIRTINRFDIIRDAMEKLGPQNPWSRRGETTNQAAERLQGALDVQAVPDTYQILVSLDGPSPKGLTEVVNAVVDTFLVKIRSEEFFGADDRIANLRSERGELAKYIEETQAQRARLAEQLGVSTFSEAFSNPYDKLLVDAKESLQDIRKQRIQAEAQLSMLDGPPGLAGVKPLEAFADEMVSKDAGLTTLDANLNQRRSVLLASMSGLEPNHPGRRAAEKELKELEDARNRVYQQLRTHYSAMILEQRKADVARARSVEKAMLDQVALQASQASEVSRGYQQAMSLGADLDRARKRVASIDDRINFLLLESRAPGFVRRFSAARTPDAPVKGGRRRLAGVALAAALLFALALPLGVDYFDPRIHWPGDLQRVLGFPAFAWLLEKSEAGKDFEREQVLRLASRLSQEYHSNHSQLFAFTSVKAQNGTTTIVTETASALTHLGLKSLAVEANAYRADPRYRSPNSRGLTVVLRGVSDLESEIVAGNEDQSDHVPVGDVNNFANLPDIQNLVQILRQSTDVYSMILVDLPPILSSVDAELIARAADVVVLVVEAENTTKGDIRRAAQVLKRIDPPAVCAVLNRVRAAAAAGFGQAARDEFYHGARQPSPLWKSPW
ncbi:MAG TPA: hypothetical protein VLT57_01970, partial [Bryobacteraceae bacterium]|nr:hypothetical protein [Bryobacteraceae bacterium]